MAPPKPPKMQMLKTETNPRRMKAMPTKMRKRSEIEIRETGASVRYYGRITEFYGQEYGVRGAKGNYQISWSAAVSKHLHTE